MEENIKKEKFMFFYLRTGGGHLAPAKATANYIEKNYSNIKTVLVDGLKEAPFYARFIVEDGYRILQNKAKWYFEFLYAVNKLKIFAKINSMLVSGRVLPYIKQQILTEKPTKIVIFHFFLIKPVYKILKENNLNIPVVTVVTDPYSAHPVWFLDKKQNIIVFSNKVKNYATKKRIPSKNIKVCNFILDEKYSNPIDKELLPELKEKYGVNQNYKTVLIVGGGDGIPRGEKIIKELMANINDANVILVCGKNKRLYNYANKLKKKKSYNNLTIYGYVDFVYELLNISDIVISKCGASTFMEILLTQKIPIINDYIWEQEKGNVDYLVENDMGIYEKHIQELPLIINKLLNDSDYYNSFINNIKSAKLKNGLPEFSDYIVKN